jgi:hypothetical protein
MCGIPFSNKNGMAPSDLCCIRGTVFSVNIMGQLALRAWQALSALWNL